MSSTKPQVSLLNRRKRKFKKKKIPPMKIIIKNTTNLIINNNPVLKTPKKSLNGNRTRGNYTLGFPNMIISKYERQRERSIDLSKFRYDYLNAPPECELLTDLNEYSHFKKTNNDNTFRPRDVNSMNNV